MKGPKIIAFSLVAAVMMIFLSLFSANVQGTDDEGATRAADYISVNDSGLGSMYIGGGDTFYVIVYNQYNGEDWIENPYQASHDDLYQVKIDVLYNEVVTIDGSPSPGIIQPTELGSMSPYHGEDGNGFRITSSWYFYTSSTNNPFAFEVNPLGAREGSYRIPVRVSGRVQVESNPEDPSGYNWRKFQEIDYLNFYIYSNVGGVENNMQMYPYESGSVPLYAGAEYISLRAPTFYPESSYLENVAVELDLPSGHFYVPNPIYNIPLFTYSMTLEWKVNVYKNTEPGMYTGTMRISYTLNGQRYSEGPYNVTVIVEPTPLIKGPETHDMTVPTVVIDQKTPSYSFEIDFTNIGNLDLESATIRLDLDSSNFIKQQSFYYNEDDDASKVYPKLECTVEDILMDDSFTAEFPVVDIFDMLPPGDYLIPIDYRLTFYDPADESGTNSRLESYQWDEIGYEDYMEMMWYRSDPRPTDLKRPHFMLRVMDDENGADLTVECKQNLDSGSKRSYVQFRIFNDEFYSITDAKVQIRSGDPDMVWSSISSGDPAVLAEGDNLNILASDFDRRTFIDLFGYVDVSSQAPTGPFDIELVLTGTDERGRPVAINRTGTVSIKARPGEITIASVATEKVEPGADFEMSIRIMNSGDVEIDEYEVMLSCSDNMICVVSPVCNGSNLAPGETRYVKFDCRASDCMDYEKRSDMALLTKINDHEGNIKEFRDDDGLPVNIIAAREPEELSSESAVRQVGIYFMIAVLAGAFIFAVGIVLSVLIFSLLRKKGDKETIVSAKERKDPGRENKEIQPPQKNQPLSPKPQTSQQIPPVGAQGYPSQTQQQPMLQPAAQQQEYQPAQPQQEYQPAPPAAQSNDLNDIFSGRSDGSSIDDLFS